MGGELLFFPKKIGQFDFLKNWLSEEIVYLEPRKKIPKDVSNKYRHMFYRIMCLGIKGISVYRGMFYVAGSEGTKWMRLLASIKEILRQHLSERGARKVIVAPVEGCKIPGSDTDNQSWFPCGGTVTANIASLCYEFLSVDMIREMLREVGVDPNRPIKIEGNLVFFGPRDRLLDDQA